MSLTTAEILATLQDQSIGKSLLILRGFREQCQAELIEEVWCMSDDALSKILNEIAIQTGWYGGQYNLLLNKLERDDRYETMKKVQAFERLCRRIARLEREALHLYVEPSMAEA